MIKLIKQISGILIVAAMLAFPYRASAIMTTGETEFGGEHFITLDSSFCDCGGNSHWILDYETNRMLMLYYGGSSVVFSNYNLDGTYQLGTYSMDSQACSVEIYDDCYDIENDGTYGRTPGTGTTLVRADGSGLNELFKQYNPVSKPQGSYFATLKNSTNGILKGFTF